jgi:SAM-dependent methyltransferase
VTNKHVRHNRKFWDADADAYQSVHFDALARAPKAWGAYRIPESQLHVLDDVRDRDVLELGCGAAQWSSALAHDGARAFGLDLSRSQLKHARHADDALPLVHASGEQLPFAPAVFDIVFCDHGALSFCDPEVIVPEVARVLRRGGQLAFCGTHPLLYLTYDEDAHRQSKKLRLTYGKLGRQGGATIDWAPPPSTWIDVLTRNDLTVERLVELVAPDDARTTYEEFAPPKWARRWPAEWIWSARRR